MATVQFYQFVFSFIMVSGLMALPIIRQKRSDDSGPLEIVVENLSQQITMLRSQLSSVNSEVAALKSKTASLDTVVAFYAYSNTHPTHGAPQSPVILNHAVTNIGNGFDPLTGVFTVPVSGLYDFQVSFMDAVRSASQTVRGAIYVDNVIRAISISDSTKGTWDHATMKAIVHVTVGQKVYMKNPDNESHSYYGDTTLPYTTFSGFLIKAD